MKWYGFLGHNGVQRDANTTNRKATSLRRAFSVSSTGRRRCTVKTTLIRRNEEFREKQRQATVTGFHGSTEILRQQEYLWEDEASSVPD